MFSQVMNGRILYGSRGSTASWVAFVYHAGMHSQASVDISEYRSMSRRSIGKAEDTHMCEREDREKDFQRPVFGKDSVGQKGVGESRLAQLDVGGNK